MYNSPFDGVNNRTYGLPWWAATSSKINFSDPNYLVNEDGTIEGAAITLLRTGSTSNLSTVDVMLNDGTATGGLDYGNSTQTITFAANQTSATVTIPIYDDDLVEGTEDLYLTLTNPVRELRSAR